MARRKRHLSPEERALWDRVTETIVPMRKQQLKSDAMPDDHPTPPRPIPEVPHRRFHVGQKSTLPALTHDLAADPADHLRGASVRMDRKNYQKMTRGKLSPEGRIDLHGMTLARAHPALTRFILSAHADGKRLVLVITGKGRDRFDDDPIPVRRGVLRHQVPHWLASPPLGALVLQVTPAHQKHGGDGAYYVYLRRSQST